MSSFEMPIAILSFSSRSVAFAQELANLNLNQ